MDNRADISRLGIGRASDFESPGRAYATPGRGRGGAQPCFPGWLAATPDPVDLVDAGNMHNEGACGGSVLFPGNGPVPLTSTPVSSSETETTMRHLGVLIAEIGKHIGDTVTAHLISDLNHVGPQAHSTDNGHQPQSTMVDMSQLNVVVKSEVKDPPTFRGDGTEKCTVGEWVDLMEIFLKKKKVVLADKADEILSKLMGRAKDVVKIALRSDPSRDAAQHPEVIYMILKQHFSANSYSCMPLADFYSTLPAQKEGVLDYWVRLNKAADVADECLQRQGKRMEDMNKEVAMMFVRHCPDQSLAMVFKSKLVEQWTAKEVQERIDEHQSEVRIRDHKRVDISCLPRQNTALMHGHEQGHSANVSDCGLQSCRQTVEQPRISDESGLTSQHGVANMTDMLSKVLESLNALHAANTFSAPRRDRKERGRCRVCGEGSHSTLEHCRNHRLCFGCHKPGHLRQSCPSAPQASPANVPSSSPQLN